MTSHMFSLVLIKANQFHVNLFHKYFHCCIPLDSPLHSLKTSMLNCFHYLSKVTTNFLLSVSKVEPIFITCVQSLNYFFLPVSQISAIFITKVTTIFYYLCPKSQLYALPVSKVSKPDIRTDLSNRPRKSSPNNIPIPMRYRQEKNPIAMFARKKK